MCLAEASFHGGLQQLSFSCTAWLLSYHSIWAIRSADNTVTELLTAMSIRSTRTPPPTATCSPQAGKAASPTWICAEAAAHLPLDFSFRKLKHPGFVSVLVHENNRYLRPGVSSVRSWAQTIIENPDCITHSFCKGFFDHPHDYTVVCSCEVPQFT